MRFYKGQHRYYCGIDLHARTLYLCVLDSQGEVRLHKRLRCEREALLHALEPYRSDLVVGTSASSAGTGSPISVLVSRSTSCSAMRST